MNSKNKKLLPMVMAAIMLFSVVAVMPVQAEDPDEAYMDAELERYLADMNLTLPDEFFEGLEEEDAEMLRHMMEMDFMFNDTFGNELQHLMNSTSSSGTVASSGIILNVPEDYPTIQVAIDAASWGDTVLVAPGTYYGSITMKPGVTIQSAEGPGVTTIRGAVYGASDSTISGFTITGSSYYGIYNWGSSPTITNNVITGSEYGIYNRWRSHSTITNNVFTGNVVGIHIFHSSPTITYNDLWGNGYNIIYYHYSYPTITNNIHADPLFADPAAGDYHLQADSPCIDAGTNDALGLPETDAEGNMRVSDGDSDGIAIVDMGAFEYGSVPPNTPPVADAGPDQTVIEGETVTFDGNDSYDSDGEIVSYEWNFGDGTTGTGVTATHVYELVGVYVVTLTVTDDDGGIGMDTMTVTVNPIPATVDIDPDTLNLQSKGKWITVYIELPEGYDVGEIDVSTVKLNDVVSAELHPIEIGDCDGDGIPNLMIKFDRTAVQAILGVGDEVEITVTGKVAGISLEGSDTIRVVSKGKGR